MIHLGPWAVNPGLGHPKIDRSVREAKGRSAHVGSSGLVAGGLVLLCRSGLQDGLGGGRELRGGALELPVDDLGGRRDLRLREALGRLAEHPHQPGVVALAEGPGVVAGLGQAPAEAERGLGDDSDRLDDDDGRDPGRARIGLFDRDDDRLLRSGGNREAQGVQLLDDDLGSAGGLGGGLGGLGGHWESPVQSVDCLWDSSLPIPPRQSLVGGGESLRGGKENLRL